MPTYEYQCDACGAQFEEFQSITAKPLRKCPSCKALKLKRLLGTGAGVIFKGSGFYETDYRSDSYKKAQQAEKPDKNKSDSKDVKSAETSEPASTKKSTDSTSSAEKTGSETKPHK